MNQPNPNLGELNDILYKGRPVERDLSAKTDYIVIAKNRLHRWWLIRVRRHPRDKVFYLNDLHHSEIKSTVDIEKSVPISRGQVTKVKSPPIYDPSKRVSGGQMVRTMPRQLRKLKEAQEHVNS